MIKIACQNCNKVYHIQEERLPEGKACAFPCPNCKDLIKIAPVPKKTQDMNPAESRKGSASSNDDSQSKPRRQDLKNKILISLTGNLPSMPQVVMKAQEIISDPGSGLKDLAKVIATDQALSVKVLKLANSAYYGLSGKVTSIGHAATLLGTQRLGEVIIMAGTLNLLGKTLKGYKIGSGEFWRHALAVGIGSRIIAKKRIPELENDAFMAGLIHDAGKIMLDPHIFERKAAFDHFFGDGEKVFIQAEKEILGFEHAEIGFEVCKNWDIPPPLTHSIRYHHEPSRSQGDPLAYVVHMADYIANTAGMGSSDDQMLYRMDDKTIAFLGLQEGDAGDITTQVTHAVEKISSEML